MNELKQKYIDLLTELDPFWTCYADPEEELKQEPSGMLYNLKQIRDNNGLEGEELKKVEDLIAAFKMTTLLNIIK